MNSADAWYEGDEETRYADGDLTPLLDLSVELAKAMNEAQREIEMNAEAIQRHPSGKVVISLPTVSRRLCPQPASLTEPAGRRHRRRCPGSSGLRCQMVA